MRQDMWTSVREKDVLPGKIFLTSERDTHNKIMDISLFRQSEDSLGHHLSIVSAHITIFRILIDSNMRICLHWTLRHTQ